MICLHCPRSGLNLAGTALPGHSAIRPQAALLEEGVWPSRGCSSLSVHQEGCGHVLPRGQKEEANVEVEANELEQELPEDRPLEGVQQDEQPQELAQGGRKQNSNCQEIFELAR